MIFLNEPLPASPAIYDPEYQRQFQYEYVDSNRIYSSGVYLSKIPKKSKSFSQQNLVQMNVLSAIYQALCLINFALQENHAPILNISEIVDDESPVNDPTIFQLVRMGDETYHVPNLNKIQASLVL